MKLSDAVDTATRSCLEAALRDTHGNVRAAARSIGVNRQTFYKIAHRCGVTVRELRVRVTVSPAVDTPMST